MNIAVIGLGRMGSAIADRLYRAGHVVFGFDLNVEARDAARESGIEVFDLLAEAAKRAEVFWLMVPIGKPVDDTIQGLKKDLRPGAIIIDGGNSKWTDSQRRAKELGSIGISFLDCGTSGGLKGREIGFSLMVGGNRAVYESIVPIFKAIAAPSGYGYVGLSGAGHYVKMVHNGIEYALLQSYAEGFQLIKQGSFKSDDLDLEKITGIWQHGSVIRSWLLDLSHEVFEEGQSLEDVSGELAEGGTGRWSVEDAEKNGVDVPMMKEAVEIRKWSRESGGNYATKVVAVLRNKFGGHLVKKLKE